MLHSDPGVNGAPGGALGRCPPSRIAPMKHLPVLVAAAIACSLGTLPASAQERGYRRDGGAVQKHYRDGGRRDWHRDYRYRHSPRFGLHWSAPYYRPYRYYDPYWYYPAPAFAYPWPPYDPAPLIVE